MTCSRLLFLPLLLSSLASLPAQTESAEPAPTSEYRFLTLSGKIGDKAAVRARLWLEPDEFTGRRLTGTYHYLSQRKPLHLSGSLEGGDVKLEETLKAFDEDITGRFQGQWHEEDLGGPVKITGTWTSADGQRKLPFTLAESNDEESAALDFYHFAESYSRQRGDDRVERSQSLVFPQVRGDSPAVNRLNDALRHLALSGDEEGSEAGPKDPAPTLRQIELSVRADIPRGKEVADLEISHFESLTYHDAMEVVLNERGLLCLRLFHTEYTGGAHGNHWARHLTFDLATGDALTLDDLLNPGWNQPLTQLAEAALRAEHDIKEGDSLAEKGPLFEETFELNDNWFLTAEGLGFSFDPYEIGPYAAGFIEPQIPMEQLRPFLKKGSPLQKLLPPRAP